MSINDNATELGWGNERMGKKDIKGVHNNETRRAKTYILSSLANPSQYTKSPLMKKCFPPPWLAITLTIYSLAPTNPCPTSIIVRSRATRKGDVQYELQK